MNAHVYMDMEELHASGLRGAALVLGSRAA